MELTKCIYFTVIFNRHHVQPPVWVGQTKTIRGVVMKTTRMSQFFALFALLILGFFGRAAFGSSFNVQPHIAAGNAHTCTLSADGTVSCWGSNLFGQLGNGTTTDSAVPVKVPSLTTSQGVTTGFIHSCALKADGTAQCWGYNGNGQLGNGTTADSASPVTVTGLSNAHAITAGNLFTCALLTGGTVQCWGGNSFGQLGNGANIDSTTPVTVPGLTGVQALVSGNHHSCALLADGTVQCWGYNFSGQLGNGVVTNSSSPVVVTGLTGVQSLAAGVEHTCALLVDGTVQCWGGNSRGQLGNGTTTSSLTPATVSGLAGVHALAADTAHNCAQLADGAVQCWGSNSFGELGNNTTSDSATPVAVSGLSNTTSLAAGNAHTCALQTDGAVQCWGRNNNGQLGNGTATDSSIPVTVSSLPLSLTGISLTPANPQILVGGTQAFTATGTFSDGGTAVLNNGISGYAKTVAAGSTHTCALRADGTVQCWGSNGQGQLGNGTFNNSPVPMTVTGLSGVQALAAGDGHTCALRADGTVQCWGNNIHGQLGNGTYNTSPTPMTVPELSGVQAVTAGAGHTCALRADGTVQCWGNNIYGQLGNGTFINSSTPVTVPGLSGVQTMTAGDGHTCALRADGTVQCWGNNIHGQLGNGTYNTSPTPMTVFGLSGVQAVTAGYGHTCAIRANGPVQCWGYGYYGQLGNSMLNDFATPGVPVQGLSGVQALAAGYGHTCALRANSTMQCWGYNYYGQLGNHTLNNAPTPMTVLGLFGLPLSFQALAAGDGHTCALRADGTVQCWGYNYYGQLGDGTTTDATVPVPVRPVGWTSNAPAIASVVLPDGVATALSGGSSLISAGYGGVIGSTNLTVLVPDITPPLISEIFTPTLPDSGWFNSDVSLYWSVTDLESAITSLVNCPDSTSSILINTDTTVTGTDYTCQATSSGGTASKTVNVKRDTVPPALALPTNMTVSATSSSGAVVNFTASASDATSGVNATGVTGSPASGSTFPIGATTVNCSATDNAGNTANGSFTITVQSTTVPTITCPADLASVDGTTIVLGTATATDAFGGTLTPTHSIIPSPFPVGNTAITWTATDAQNNAASCTQHVGIFAPLTHRQLSAGSNHACEVKTDGTVACWGSNGFGESTPTVGAFIQVSTGTNFTCGLKTDGSIACWGSNNGGQASPPAGTFVSISAGDAHSCGVRTNGSVACWGANIVGDATPPNGNDFVEVSAGQQHTCGLKTDGTLSCWGDNSNGRSTPPAGTFLKVSVGKAHACALMTDGTVACWGFDAYGETIPPAGIYSDVNAGSLVSCAVRQDNALVCWGRNDAGQATPPSGSFTKVSAGNIYGMYSCGVMTDGSSACWGDNGYGQAPQLAMNLTTIPDGTAGTTYSQQDFALVVSNTPQFNNGVYTPAAPQQFTSSPLPDGLALNTKTGVLAGTPTPSAAGTHNVTITGADGNGFSASHTYTMTIAPADTIPPVITPTVTGSAGANGWYTSDVNVNWTVIDNIDPYPTKTGCATTTMTTETASQVITCSATDHYNNTASQSVTIKLDKTIPVLGVLPTVGPIEATAASGAAVTYTNPAAIDNFGAPVVQCSPISGTVLGLGVNAIACTATDNAGLASTGIFNVTVRDTTPPTVVLPAPITVLATSSSGAMVTYSASAIDIVSTSVLVSCIPASGSIFPVGTTAVTCSATDGAGNTASGIFTVTVNLLVVNTPPVTANDAYTLAHIGTTPVTVSAPGVLSNDVDIDGNALIVVGATTTTPKIITLTAANGTASGGTVALYADGHFVYTPSAAGFNGTRSFTYQVTDGQAISNTATVSLTIRRAPTAANDSATTNLGQAVAINVIANDTAYNTATIVPGTVTIVSPPANGGVTVNANGTVSYMPNSGFGGTDAFTYTVNDSTGAISNIATVTVYVPVAIEDSYTFTANTSATQTIFRIAATGVLANDQPIGRAGRTVTLINGITRTGGIGTATLGPLTLNTNGAFSFTLTAPASATTGALRQASKRGTYQFTYTETLSGVTTAPATATITIQ